MIVGSFLAVLALPVIAVLAAGVALSLRAWPFFVHDRVGGQGLCFRVLKLRTLPVAAPRYADKYAIGSVPIPRFTSFLRRTHLDELPQLFLVPLGVMSLVGPRPEMPHLHLAGDPGFAAVRTSVRPGCTGLWQVSQDADKLIWESEQYDRFYIDHASLRFDLWILKQSVLVILGIGARVDLPAVPGWVSSRPGQAGARARFGLRGGGQSVAPVPAVAGAQRPPQLRNG